MRTQLPPACIAVARVKRLLVRLATLIVLALPTAAYADCGCGPDYCTGDPRYPAAFAQMKQQIYTSENPPPDDRLMLLLNNEGKCFVCASTAPVIFTIIDVTASGFTTTPWTEHDEEISHQQSDNCTLKGYYIVHSAEACSCCGELKYNQRSDWNSDLEINTDLAFHYAAPDSCNAQAK